MLRICLPAPVCTFPLYLAVTLVAHTSCAVAVWEAATGPAAVATLPAPCRLTARHSYSMRLFDGVDGVNGCGRRTEERALVTNPLTFLNAGWFRDRSGVGRGADGGCESLHQGPKRKGCRCLGTPFHSPDVRRGRPAAAVIIKTFLGQPLVNRVTSI
jgi:hypothetical protein